MDKTWMYTQSYEDHTGKRYESTIGPADHIDDLLDAWISFMVTIGYHPDTINTFIRERGEDLEENTKQDAA